MNLRLPNKNNELEIAKAKKKKETTINFLQNEILLGVNKSVPLY